MKIKGKEKAQKGKMDVISTESYVNTRMKRYMVVDVIVPKLEYARVTCEDNTKFVMQLGVIRTTAKNILGCSKTMRTTLFRSR